MGEQCDDTTLKHERLVWAMETQNPKYVHRKLISWLTIIFIQVTDNFTRNFITMNSYSGNRQLHQKVYNHEQLFRYSLMCVCCTIMSLDLQLLLYIVRKVTVSENRTSMCYFSLWSSATGFKSQKTDQRTAQPSSDANKAYHLLVYFFILRIIPYDSFKGTIVVVTRTSMSDDTNC